jgi:uncharacterized membrane protein
MCKKKDNNNQAMESEETVNVGLVNVSSNSISSVPIWEIIEIVSLVILLLLVIRWIRKWLQKRKHQRQSEQNKILRNLIASPTTVQANQPIIRAIEMTNMTSTSARPEINPTIMEIPTITTTSSGFDRYR